jgi:C-terminal processing protease CtpA/Prc
MKNKILLLLLVVAQTAFGSNNLTENQKLATTCKVWGFLKYYHPNVADGSKNWDEQLFIILPQIEKVQTKEEFSLVIENWIDSLGEVKRIAPIIPAKDIEYFDKNFDLSWFNNKLFSKKLSEKLKFIENNRFHGTPFFMTVKDFLQFKNEVKYPNFKWTDKKLRLLTLFRYWNYIEYFFPYKYKMDQNWDITLNEMLPKISTQSSEIDFHLAMKELSAKINDSHASFETNKIYEYMGNKFIPVDIKIIDKKAVIVTSKNDSLAKINDLKVGDVITKVDGKTISKIIQENSKYIGGSNESTILKNIYWAIFNGNTNTLEIEFVRSGKTSTKIINRYLYKDLKIIYPQKDKWKVLNNNIGYVNMGELLVVDIPLMMKQLKNTKAIIFDIRNYPHVTGSTIAEYLNPEPKEYAKFLYPDFSYPSRYIWGNENGICGKINTDYYKGEVIILVNEKSISQSETTAMMFKLAPKATIIGSQTAGADGANYQFEIIKGIQTSFTCTGFFYPNKKEVQRIGIVPDIEVKQTIKGIQEGRDEVLDEAIRFINK